MEPAVPRPAATVILLRRGGRHAERGLEILLVERNPEARFMPGVWVFPGGAVDPADGDGEASHRVAAVRELAEEAGIELGPEELVAYSRWITPKVVPIRFDTRFYLAPVPDEAEPRIDHNECIDWGWWAPMAALEAYARDELPLVFPTIKTLEQLSGFDSATSLLDWAQGREVVPIEPRVVLEGEVARVILPGEPGYEDA